MSKPLAWSTDGDIISDGTEVDWEYDPLDTDDPIDAEELTYSSWVKAPTAYVRANHYSAMSYVIVYAKYRPEVGPWTNLFYVGTDYSPTNWGDYYLWWTYLQGYVQMQVAVKAYNSGGVLIGSDYSYVTLPTGGGGGGGVPI